MQDGDGWRVSVAPASQLDLLVALDGDGRAFLAATVTALEEVAHLKGALDPQALSDRFNGWVRIDGSRTVNPHVFRVVGGQELRIADGSLEWRRWWQPAEVAIICEALPKLLAERLRVTAEEVVSRHLPAAGPVAVHLSGGRDSSLLCALAAKQLAAAGRKVHAMTAVPCAGQVEAGDRHQYDESAAAIATASRFENVTHHLIRPRPVKLATVLDRLHRQLGEPIQQPVSLSWLVPQFERCTEHGVEVLLTGDNGNFSLSAGGVPNLSDVWSEEGPLQWLETSRRLLAEGVELREVMRVSLGPHLPLWLYKLARKRGRPAPLVNNYPFFRGALRDTLLAMTPESGDPRPGPSDRALVREVAESLCSLIPVGRFDYGVELVACCNDRALFELMLSVPSSMLASAPDRRLLFDTAFADLLPNEVLRPARRGRQNVDFHASVDPIDLQQGIERYRQSALCNALVDLDQLASSAAAWPTERDTDIRHFGFWVGQFLPAVSLASFLFTRDHADASAPNADPLHAGHEPHTG